jgi:hypothetical protein
MELTGAPADPLRHDKAGSGRGDLANVARAVARPSIILAAFKVACPFVLPSARGLQCSLTERSIFSGDDHTPMNVNPALRSPIEREPYSRHVTVEGSFEDAPDFLAQHARARFFDLSLCLRGKVQRETKPTCFVDCSVSEGGPDKLVGVSPSRQPLVIMW